MQKLFAIVAIAIWLTALASCGAVKDSDAVGKDFYDCLKERNYEKAMQLLDPEAINYTPADIWDKGLRKNGDALGMILNVERLDFESQTLNNVTRVAIKYKVHYSKGIMFERLEFIERNEEYRITYYKYDEDSTMVN